jgi:aryl carrier-like protein
MLLCDSLDSIRAVWLMMSKREEGGQHVFVQGLHVHS